MRTTRGTDPCCWFILCALRTGLRLAFICNDTWFPLSGRNFNFVSSKMSFENSIAVLWNFVSMNGM
jgi:hypothetical protein